MCRTKCRVEKILGMEFATIYFNEYRQIRYATVQLVRNRLAQVVPGLYWIRYGYVRPICLCLRALSWLSSKYIRTAEDKFACRRSASIRVTSLVMGSLS